MFSQHINFKKPDDLLEKKIGDIISQMTLEEKISMLSGSQNSSQDNGNTVPCRRVGIPSFRMADASVGVHWWIDGTTTYPSSIGLAASFNVDLAERYAEAVGRDCRAAGVHILLGPGVNIYRSPLCGRNFEYYGEDPWLASKMAVSFIKGVQRQGVSATIKHYAVNFQEYERHKISSDLDERTLREVYCAAFEAGVIEGGAGAIMTAYNSVNGVHCAEHYHLIQDILKGEWGFDGIVMSDWVSTYDAINSANAGLDLEMPHAKWMNHLHLVPAVKEGRISELVIDDKIRRLLRLAFAFGWMENEQKFDEDRRNEKNAAVALDVARESTVLLKNDGILPLDLSKHKRIAVLGPVSHPAVICGGGSAFNKPSRSVSILDGIKALTADSKTEIIHCKGIDPWHSTSVFPESVFSLSDGKKGVNVEYFNSNDCSGSPVLTRTEELINNMWKEKQIVDGVDKSNFSIRYNTSINIQDSGKYILYIFVWDGACKVFIDDNLVFDIWNREAFGDHEVIVDLQKGLHTIKAEFRNIRNWNQFCLGWESINVKNTEYENAIKAANSCDAVIFCGGFTEKSEGEGSDRSFGMHPDIEKLLLEVLDINTNVITVLIAGGNVDMNAWHDRTRAILHAWFPGQEGGTAIAEILTGLVNPSGRLPATFEYNLQDRSSYNCYHDDDKDFRVALTDGVFGGYRHFDRIDIKPRFPFGYGLSYTTFKYENLKLSSKIISKHETLTVSFDIINTGNIKGKEVAQVYIGDDQSSVPRPVKELKGFIKCELDAGERKRVSLEINSRALAFYDLDSSNWKIESGIFTVFVGASSGDIRLSDKFEVKCKCSESCECSVSSSAEECACV